MVLLLPFRRSNATWEGSTSWVELQELWVSELLVAALLSKERLHFKMAHQLGLKKCCATIPTLQIYIRTPLEKFLDPVKVAIDRSPEPSKLAALCLQKIYNVVITMSTGKVNGLVVEDVLSLQVGTLVDQVLRHVQARLPLRLECFGIPMWMAADKVQRCILPRDVGQRTVGTISKRRFQLVQIGSQASLEHVLVRLERFFVYVLQRCDEVLITVRRLVRLLGGRVRNELIALFERFQATNEGSIVRLLCIVPVWLLPLHLLQRMAIVVYLREAEILLPVHSGEGLPAIWQIIDAHFDRARTSSCRHLC
mmetsp:Transcript_157255/g.286310  ORF Transcript_157255/g.286310 Transcript_157255/m.286310 type:complete len:309 (+) Transcript_157255:189-1115(+)